jgi:hypothetical protein
VAHLYYWHRKWFMLVWCLRTQQGELLGGRENELENIKVPVLFCTSQQLFASRALSLRQWLFLLTLNSQLHIDHDTHHLDSVDFKNLVQSVFCPSYSKLPLVFVLWKSKEDQVAQAIRSDFHHTTWRQLQYFWEPDSYLRGRLKRSYARNCLLISSNFASCLNETSTLFYFS